MKKMLVDLHAPPRCAVLPRVPWKVAVRFIATDSRSGPEWYTYLISLLELCSIYFLNYAYTSHGEVVVVVGFV